MIIAQNVKMEHFYSIKNVFKLIHVLRERFLILIYAQIARVNVPHVEPLMNVYLANQINICKLVPVMIKKLVQIINMLVSIVSQKI